MMKFDDDKLTDQAWEKNQSQFKEYDGSVIQMAAITLIHPKSHKDHQWPWPWSNDPKYGTWYFSFVWHKVNMNSSIADPEQTH